MNKHITAADANRKFSELLSNVRQGASYTVTSHGRPVATITPVEEGARDRLKARRLLLQRLASQPATDIGRWTRDELYED